VATGRIKVWNLNQGWGFIEGDDGDDYFLNISNFRKGQAPKIGLKVKFDIFQGQRGAEAENASLI
tara:strand:+ start:823 stop:1017 length:195 start_codon:yes stop_codon:yes gene_type:complete